MCANRRATCDARPVFIFRLFTPNLVKTLQSLTVNVTNFGVNKSNISMYQALYVALLLAYMLPDTF